MENLSNPFLSSPQKILTSLLSSMLSKRLAVLESKTKTELIALQATKKNIKETLTIVDHCLTSLSRSRRSKTPSSIISTTSLYKKRNNYSKNIPRPLTPLPKKSYATTTSKFSNMTPIKIKTNSHLSKTPIVIRKRKNHIRNISGMIGNVSNVDDELLTTINTDVFSRNSILPKNVMFPLNKLFDRDYTLVKFLPFKDVFNYTRINKHYGIVFIDEIINRVQAKIYYYQKEIEKDELSELDNFNKRKITEKDLIMSNKSKKALELLNERSYMDIFYNIKNKKVKTVRPSDNVLKIYEILFQLMNKKDILCYVDNKDIFWEKICNYFIINAKGKFGLFVQNLINHFDLSDHNLQVVLSISRPYLNIFMPSYFTKICSTTALVVFALKDILEIIGLGVTNYSKNQNKKNKIIKLQQIRKKIDKLKQKIFLQHV